MKTECRRLSRENLPVDPNKRSWRSEYRMFFSPVHFLWQAWRHVGVRLQNLVNIPEKYAFHLGVYRGFQ